jgi:fructose-1-phosphate kinase PfkB-like protein
VTFLGGPLGAYCETLLRRDDALDPLVIRTGDSTRVILTVRTEGTADQTAFFDPDPAITVAESEELRNAVEAAAAAGGVEAITLSGSSPAPMTHGLYSDLVGFARSERIPVFLDTYGPALDAVWGFWPDVIQLNRREAATYLRNSNPSDHAIFTMLDGWARRGVKLGLVTDGPNAVLIRVADARLRAWPPRIDVVNPIGSGDCLLAGLADAWLANLDSNSSIQHGLACAVANALVWDAGAIDPAEVAQRERTIQIEPARM